MEFSGVNTWDDDMGVWIPCRLLLCSLYLKERIVRMCVCENFMLSCMCIYAELLPTLCMYTDLWQIKRKNQKLCCAVGSSCLFCCHGLGPLCHGFSHCKSIESSSEWSMLSYDKTFLDGSGLFQIECSIEILEWCVSHHHQNTNWGSILWKNGSQGLYNLSTKY